MMEICGICGESAGQPPVSGLGRWRFVPSSVDYDAWNRLVLVRSSVDADVTIQTAEFDP
jgi:hypothetical protein